MYQGNFPEESFPSPMRSESAILGARASTLWEYDPEKEWLSEGIDRVARARNGLRVWDFPENRKTMA